MQLLRSSCRCRFAIAARPARRINSGARGGDRRRKRDGRSEDRIAAASRRPADEQRLVASGRRPSTRSAPSAAADRYFDALAADGRDRNDREVAGDERELFVGSARARRSGRDVDGERRFRPATARSRTGPKEIAPRDACACPCPPSSMTARAPQRDRIVGGRIGERDRTADRAARADRGIGDDPRRARQQRRRRPRVSSASSACVTIAPMRNPPSGRV